MLSYCLSQLPCKRRASKAIPWRACSLVYMWPTSWPSRKNVQPGFITFWHLLTSVAVAPFPPWRCIQSALAVAGSPSWSMEKWLLELFPHSHFSSPGLSAFPNNSWPRIASMPLISCFVPFWPHKCYYYPPVTAGSRAFIRSLFE